MDPGIIKNLEHKMLSYKEVYTRIFGSGEMPPDIHLPTNENCLQCHSEDREVSPSGDIKIPHREHVEMRGLQLRGLPLQRGAFPPGDPGGPPPMDVCYMCHDGVKAPNACETCHVNPPSEAGSAPASTPSRTTADGQGPDRGLPPLPQRRLEFLRGLP